MSRNAAEHLGRQVLGPRHHRGRRGERLEVFLRRPAFSAEQAKSGATVEEFLKRLHPAWNVVGQVRYHLAENRKDEEAPFAFVATYTSWLSAHGQAQHQPLGQVLREYAGQANKERSSRSSCRSSAPRNAALAQADGEGGGPGTLDGRTGGGPAARARESGHVAMWGRAAPRNAGRRRDRPDLLDQARNGDLRFHVEASFLLYVG